MLVVKEYCKSHQPVAYANIFTDEILYIHGIEYDTNDFAYVSDVFGSKTTYHKLQIRYQDGSPYVKIHNVRVYLDKCVKLDDTFVIITKETKED